MSTVTLIPAYGRDYKSRAAVLADLKAGKDFIESMSGKPVDRYGLPFEFNVRYQANRKVAVFKRSELE